MKNICDTSIHEPMNAKGNVITNYFFYRSSGEIPCTMSINNDTPTEIQK
jgi:hypothetical protein